MTDAPSGRNKRGVMLDAARCREARRALGLTQEKLAERSLGPNSLSLVTIKRAEGARPVDFGTAQRLASLLQVELSALRLDAPVQTSTEGREPHLNIERESRTAIAVWPFELRGSSEDPACVHDVGLVHELLIGQLAGWWFPVVSQRATSMFSPTGPTLGVRYAVTGCIRHLRSEVRIAVELSETTGHDIVWAGQVSFARGDLRTLQERLCFQVATRIAGAVLDVEMTRAARRSGAETDDAQQLALRGAWHFYRATAADNVTARAHLQQALERDPWLRAARYWLCMTYQQELAYQWAASPNATLQHLTSATQEFRRLHPQDPTARVAHAYGLVYRGERDAALACLNEALEQHEQLTAARSLYGQVLAMSDRADEALEQLEIAQRLSPLDPRLQGIKVGRALSYFVDHRYDEMVGECRSALSEGDSTSMLYGTLACGLAYLGDIQQANAMLRHMLKLGVNSSEAMELLMASTKAEIATRFKRGLHLAGLRA